MRESIMPPITMADNQTYENEHLFTWGEDGEPLSIVNLAYAQADAEQAVREQEEAAWPSIFGSEA